MLDGQQDFFTAAGTSKVAVIGWLVVLAIGFMFVIYFLMQPDHN
jgi:hypothetical protein